MSWEINFIVWFQKLGGENSFFFYLQRFFSSFGEEYVFLVILFILYWIYDKKTAEVVGFTLLFSSCFNSLLKNIVKRQRPYKTSMDIKNLDSTGGFSYPSGHSQGAAVLYPSIALKYKKKWITIIAIALPLLVAQSRTYLGVHFPTDVLGGLALGTIIMFIINMLYEKHSRSIQIISLIVFLPGLFFMYFIPYFKDMTKDYFMSYFALLGFVAGINFEKRFVYFKNTKVWWVGIIRFVVGILIVFGIKEGVEALICLIGVTNPMTNLWLHSIPYLIIVFVAVGVYPLLFKYIDQLFKIKTSQTNEQN
ncbi:MAG: phosphatase PAP2 family protein [Clostridia bacterium]